MIQQTATQWPTVAAALERLRAQDAGAATRETDDDEGQLRRKPGARAARKTKATFASTYDRIRDYLAKHRANPKARTCAALAATFGVTTPCMQARLRTMQHRKQCRKGKPIPPPNAAMGGRWVHTWEA